MWYHTVLRFSIENFNTFIKKLGHHHQSLLMIQSLLIILLVTVMIDCVVIVAQPGST